ncbi:MAG: TIGR02300 family protein [Rhizobiales bacterium]|nr:TIGR02300 family protein [Hyphomicrobiales bacterium]
MGRNRFKTSTGFPMTKKADRGTKRVCRSCNGRFYDLNRSEIICPLCGAEYQMEADDARPDPVLEEEARKRAAPAPKRPVAPVVGEDIADEDLADISVDVAEVEADDDEDDAFLEEDEVEGDDVTGILGGGVEPEEDEV